MDDKRPPYRDHDFNKIRNCTFTYECTLDWDDLRRTEDQQLRHCDKCEEFVYLCETDEEFIAHVSEGHCVAKLMPRGMKPEHRHTLGRGDEVGAANELFFIPKELAKDDAVRGLKADHSSYCPDCGFPLADGAKCNVCPPSLGPRLQRTDPSEEAIDEIDQETEQQRLQAHNDACLRIAELKPACPYCDSAENLEFFDKSPESKCYFICRICARSSRPEDFVADGPSDWIHK